MDPPPPCTPRNLKSPRQTNSDTSAPSSSTSNTSPDICTQTAADLEATPSTPPSSCSRSSNGSSFTYVSSQSRRHSAVDSDTPFKNKSGSSVGINCSQSYRPAVDVRVVQELQDAVYIDVPNFIDAFFDQYRERSRQVFERAVLRRTYSDSNASWYAWPATPTESNVLRWFRETLNPEILAPESARCVYSSRNRVLTGGYGKRKADLLISGLDLDDAGAENIIHDWRNIRVVGELKANRAEDGRAPIIVQLANYAREMFYAQPFRMYVHAFTLCGDLLRTWVFDRAGATASVAFSINQEPLRFLEVMLFYASASTCELGFDHTVRGTKIVDGVHVWSSESLPYDPTILEAEHIRCGTVCSKPVIEIAWGKEKENCRLILADEPLHRLSSLVSRGSTCWQAAVFRSGSKEVPKWEYVVKQQWASTERVHEGELLAKAQGVFGVAQYYWHGPVLSPEGLPTDVISTIRRNNLAGVRVDLSCGNAEISGEPQGHIQSASGSTRTSRKRSSSHSDAPILTASATTKRQRLATSVARLETAIVHNRVLRRLVASPIGSDITTFRSYKELLSALRDAIEGHRTLFRDCQVLHRDISHNNILINRSETGSDCSDIPGTDCDRPRRPCGFLIDFDYAISVDRNEVTGAKDRTGTPMFMAIEVLDCTARHNYRHDLESFFYVFIYICTFFSGPLSRARSDHGKLKIMAWEVGDATLGFQELAYLKRSMMTKQQFKGIVEEFDGGMSGVFGPLAEKWRDVLFPLNLKSEEINVGAPAHDVDLHMQILGLLDEVIAKLAKEESSQRGD